jgi:hypothetical protein
MAASWFCGLLYCWSLVAHKLLARWRQFEWFSHNYITIYIYEYYCHTNLLLLVYYCSPYHGTLMRATAASCCSSNNLYNNRKSPHITLSGQSH